MSASEVL